MSLHSAEEKREALERAHAADIELQGLLDVTEKGAVRSHVGNLQLILTHDARWVVR